MFGWTCTHRVPQGQGITSGTSPDVSILPVPRSWRSRVAPAAGGWVGSAGRYRAAVRALIIRLGAFGDIIHTLPLAADLVADGWTVDWLAEDRWSMLLDGNPAVSRVVGFPRRELRDSAWSWRQRLGLLWRLVGDLRRERYDAVIDAQGLAKSALLSASSGGRRRIGHDRSRARELAWLVPSTGVPCVAEHVIDQQRDLGRPLLEDRPVSGPWRFPLPAWSDDKAWAAAWLAENRLERPWVLNVGAGWPTKVWPVERQVELVRSLGAAGEPVLVVWGSPSEGEVAQRVVAEAGWGVAAPRTTIPQLAGLLASGRMVVSGDTGPLHLALAVGTPAVGLFGPVPATRNGPKGRGYRCLQAPGAAWERRDVSKVDMGAISAAAVVAEARAALAEASGAPDTPP